MTRISLLGIPHDDNSSFAKGAALAPAHIRPELFCDAYSMWSETGFDLTDRLVDQGDIRFDATTDPWDLIEREVGRVLGLGDPAICLGGDHAISWPVLRAVRRRHSSLTILHIDAHPDSMMPIRAIRAPTPRPLPATWKSGLPTASSRSDCAPSTTIIKTSSSASVSR